MAKGRKTGGREKGSQNRVTVQVKEALEQTFDEMGGVAALAAWGRENQTAFYTLWAKLLPREIKAEVVKPQAEIVLYRFPDDGRDQPAQYD